MPNVNITTFQMAQLMNSTIDSLLALWYHRPQGWTHVASPVQVSENLRRLRNVLRVHSPAQWHQGDDFERRRTGQKFRRADITM